MNIDPDKINVHPYAAAIYHHLQGQEVEVHCGDTKTIMKYSDYDSQLRSVIVGTIQDVMGDCIIIEVKGHPIFLNVWGIKAISPVSKDLSLKDMFKDEEFTFNRRYAK